MMISAAIKGKFSRITIPPLFILFFPFLSVFAQQPLIEFNKPEAFEKIAKREYSAIVQDKSGFLWLGTQEGLFRFDGNNVKTFRKRNNDSGSLPSDRVNRLFVDNSGLLWVVTTDGLCRFNPEYELFTPLVSNSNTKGLPEPYINCITEDREGNLVVSDYSCVYRFDKQQDKFLKMHEIEKGKINALLFDKQNNLWIACSDDGGLYFKDQTTNQLIRYQFTPNASNSISGNELMDIQISNDVLWIASYGSGIDAFDLRTKTFRNYRTEAYYENYSFQIFVDKNQNIWACTLGSLKLFDPKTNSFFNYFADPSNPKSLPKNIKWIYQDHAGYLWTVHSDGEIRIASINNTFHHLNANQSEFWHTSENNITAISEDQYGNLWCGNFYNGIDIFKWQESKTERRIHINKDKNSLGNGTVFAIYRDSGKNMWVGTNLGGLQLFNEKNKNFTSYISIPGDSLSISGNDVRSIAEDKNGDLWLAIHGKGIDKFDRKKKIFINFSKEKNRLSNPYTTKTLVDSEGNIWVGSVWGLNLLRKGENKFENFYHNSNDSISLSSNNIHDIHEDSEKVIWIATDTGINKYNPENKTFTRYFRGLKNRHVASITSDKYNTIWISTMEGISKFDPLTGHFINFDISDGLHSTYYYDRSLYYSAEKNEIFYGGNYGIDIFNTDSIKSSTTIPKVVLTDFLVFNKSVSYKTDSTILDKHISSADQIVLNAKSNSITFRFQVIDLMNASKISYQYRLDGFDKEWIDGESRNEANYTNLPPGKYLFRVKAKYRDQEWAENNTSIRVNIIPEWWMTVWFKILLLLLFLITPVLIIKRRTSRLNKRSELLEQLVAERTDEIRLKNELLHQQANDLALKNELLHDSNATKDKLFSIISHDLRSPFSAVLGFLDIMLNDYDDFSDKERKEMIDRVYNSSNQIYTLIENLLNWAKLQTQNIKYEPSRIELRNLTSGILELYQSNSAAKEIKIRNEIKPGTYAFADAHFLTTTLRNLLSNAFKFTPTGGSITLQSSQTDHTITLSVIDSGIGMSEEQLSHLFSLENSSSIHGTNGETGSGLGLILCKDFVEKNKGTITVSSQPGKGCNFSFTLPASV